MLLLFLLLARPNYYGVSSPGPSKDELGVGHVNMCPQAHAGVQSLVEWSLS